MSEAKVLVVDDEKEFLDSISERMENRGYSVDTATSGPEALKKLDTESFDAIVLDFMMPEMDGLETLQRIRENHPELQVILLTGHATLDKGVEAIKLGAMDFLEKPAKLELLTAKIKEAKAKRMVLVQEKHEKAIQEVLTRKGW